MGDFVLDSYDPGGFYCEIARTLVLGPASGALKDAFASVKAAQAHTLSLIRPSADPAEIAAAHDAYMQSRGLPPEPTWHPPGSEGKIACMEARAAAGFAVEPAAPGPLLAPDKDVAKTKADAGSPPTVSASAAFSA